MTSLFTRVRGKGYSRKLDFRFTDRPVMSATYDCHTDGGKLQGAWDERRAALTEGLDTLQPDVVAFQEAITGDGYDQVADLLGPGYHAVRQSVGLVGDGNHGASIASRWPLGEVREADLHLTPRTADYQCGTLAAEVLAPEPIGPLLFVAHGPSHQLGYEFERERQSVTAARLIEELLDRRGRAT